KFLPSPRKRERRLGIRTGDDKSLSMNWRLISFACRTLTLSRFRVFAIPKVPSSGSQKHERKTFRRAAPTHLFQLPDFLPTQLPITGSVRLHSPHSTRPAHWHK